MGTTRPSVVTFLAERPDHGLGVPVDDGEQHPSCPVGNTPTLFPLLNSPHVETEAFGELLTAQPKPLAEGDNPAWQLRLAADMGENLAQRRFDLTSELGAFTRHWPVVPFLIAATRRASALVSAGVRSSRSAFA